jgi:hypothetical protein
VPRHIYQEVTRNVVSDPGCPGTGCGMEQNY